MDDAALGRLILQRTRHYITIAGKEPLREWTRTGRTDHLAAALGERRAEYLEAVRHEIVDDAADVMRRVRFMAARPVRRMVSIGPGEGAAEAIIAEDLRLTDVLLVDVETGGHTHGPGGLFDTGAGYCSLAAAAAAVRAAAPGCRVVTWNPNHEPAPVFSFDVCVSLYAMEFHFGRGQYSDWLAANAAPGALEVYDSRNAGRVCRPVPRG